MILHVQRDARSGIADLENDDFLRMAAQFLEGEPGGECDETVSADCLGGVLDDVDEDLFELLWVGAERCFGDATEGEFDLVLSQFGREQLRGKGLCSAVDEHDFALLCDRAGCHGQERRNTRGFGDQ